MLASEGHDDRPPEVISYTSVLDLLALDCLPNGEIAREIDAFAVFHPWGVARYGRVALSAGWWRFECETDGDESHVEIRLSSAQDPLLVFRASHSDSTRVYLNSSVRDLSLMISAWPGRFAFKVLRLTKLSDEEQRRIALTALGRFVTGKRSPSVLLRSVKRLFSGQSIGVKLAPADVATVSSQAPASMSEGGPLPVRRITRIRDFDIAHYEHDELHEDASDIIAREFDVRPGIVAAYSDVEEGGRIVPHPCWDGDLAKNFPFTDAPFYFRAGALGAPADVAGQIQQLSNLDSRLIRRIPLPLVRRARPVARGFARPPRPTLDAAPRVSVIIPTKFRLDLLELCLDGLAGQTDYPDLEVIVVDNGSADPRFDAVLKAKAAQLDLRVIRDDQGFNFSRLINRGAEAASGSILLLLNDDVVPREAGWLHRMVASAMREDTGAVGARLLYPDDSVQHAGVALGIGGVCGHLWKGMTRDAARQNPYVALPGARLAVTGACLAVRRDVFEKVGGLDMAFAVAFNDIDFCLRVHAAGYLNVYRGDAVLSHHESQSRGHDDASSKKQRRLAKETELFFERWRDILERDPYSSPAFDQRVESGLVHPAAWSRGPYRLV